MSDSLKRRLAESFSPQAKLLMRRLFVGTIGACVRLTALTCRAGRRVIGLAVAHGLDLGRAWDVGPAARPFAPEPFGARDFLMLADAAAARRPPAGTAGEAGESGPTLVASVIIPALNNVESTFQCLRSLFRELNFSEAEVIVVDGTRDETARLLAHFQGAVRVLRDEERRGFAAACDRGAEAARGRHLVFLDGEAAVLPGWLRHLVETAESDPAVGAVGSLSLYPDGRIREAGAVVWRDGSVSSYGRGDSLEERKYSFAREVDYCSNASLLVRRDLFRELGGFDQTDAPANLAGADLCLRLRSLGRRIIYQPASRLVRFGTTNDDPEAATDRAQFSEKWRGVLEREHLARDPARLAEAADRRRNAPYLFIFDDIVPTPDRDAGSGRMLNILRTLARWGRPVFIYRSKRPAADYEGRLWAEGVETAPLVEYARLLRERRPAVAVLSRPEVADLLIRPLRLAAPNIKIIFDMVDAHFVRYGREAETTGDAEAARRAESYRELETRLARSSDMVWCASSEDGRVMESAAPSVPVRVVPTIHRPRGIGAPFDARGNLLFVGNYRHHPNEDAVHYLVREILPRVRELLPGAAVLLVGDNASDEIRAYDSEQVRVLGYVPDVEPLLETCRVFVAPLRFGAGMKGKILEAFAHGLPVVTTTVGAESMGIADGEQALIRDDPREFAEATARLYLDGHLWEKLARGGREHVGRHFSPEVIGRVINDSIRELVAPSAGRGLDAGEPPTP
jgi:O-antigen biosynthesis protein